MLTTQPMVGVPRVTGTQATKLERSGLLGLSDPCHSPELHLPEPRSQCSPMVLCMHCLAPTQGTFEPRRSVIDPTCSEWLLTYFSMMVFICAPLSKRAIQLSPFIFTLAMFSIPYHHWKGSGFKKGVCKVVFTPQEPLSGGSSCHLLLSEGSRLPSLTLSPPSHLTVSCL